MKIKCQDVVVFIINKFITYGTTTYVKYV